MNDISSNERTTTKSISFTGPDDSTPNSKPTSFDETNEEAGWHQVVDTGLVQNRITIAGFVLTLLVFTSTIFLAFIALAVQGQDSTKRIEYVLSAPWVYVNTILPIFLGFLLAISSIVLLLVSQQLHRQWIFVVAEILIYLALAEFLSGGLSKIANVVVMSARYGSPAHPYLGSVMVLLTKILPLPLWLMLLFVAPLIKVWNSRERSKTAASYACVLLLMMISSALSFQLKRDGAAGVLALLLSFLKQVVQPIFW